MPEKIGKPLQKSDEEKAADRKLVEEIENDPKDPKGMTVDHGTTFDPLEAQAERLPNSIKGADGDQPHVFSVNPEHDRAEIPRSDSFDDDEELGGGIGDPSKLTAD